MLLGLTGGIACGKSTAAAIFADNGWQVIDMDAVCRRFYADADGPAAGAMAARWGCRVVSGNGADRFIDRRKVAGIVFADQGELIWLESLLHPLAEKFLLAVENRDDKLTLIDAAMLYEAGWDKLCDRVAAVWSTPEICRGRLGGRGWTAEEYSRRSRCQIPPEDKLERADYGIVNNGTMKFLTVQTLRLSDRLKDDFDNQQEKVYGKDRKQKPRPKN